MYTSLQWNLAECVVYLYVCFCTLTHTRSGLMVCTNPAWVDLLEYIDNDHHTAHVYLFVSMFPVPFQEEGSLKDLFFFHF